ncbi:MAG: SDR family oxidoreductase [Myxococcota bacterium]|jgi:short-subunit dehydrogenase|nr:SDR family oxidoreductase [Myxococcota bacterium]
MELQGSAVALTGAAGGIGSALAAALDTAGARLALLDRDLDGLQQLESTRAWRTRPLLLPCDVTDEAACDEQINAVLAQLGGLDVLINNAGISHRSIFEETESAVLRRVMEVNFFGAVNCTRAALPSLLERAGTVVAISSVAGFAPLVGRTGYCASKHALEGFMGALRSEVSSRGVGVLVVCPAFTDTALKQRALDAAGNPMGEGVRAVSGRVLQPSEVADGVLRALRRDRQRLLIPAVSRASYYLSRLAPSLYQRLMLRSQGAEFPLEV